MTIDLQAIRERANRASIGGYTWDFVSVFRGDVFALLDEVEQLQKVANMHYGLPAYCPLCDIIRPLGSLGKLCECPIHKGQICADPKWFRLQAMNKQLVDSQAVLFYALDDAGRSLRVGYSSGMAATIRDQHGKLINHRPDCDGCIVSYEAQQQEVSSD